MFEDISAGSPDPILSLLSLYKKDSNKNKVNVAVGIYYNDHGKLENLSAVSEAEAIITQENKAKTYLAITGEPEYTESVKALLFQDPKYIKSENCLTMQGPGGTGSLRIAAEFFARFYPKSTVYISDPSWPIHLDIFNSQHLSIKTYPYRDAHTNQLDFEQMLTTLSLASPQDILLLHGCCHNPTGIDPSKAQWTDIAKLAQEKGLIILLDFAYQGFANSVEEDATCIQTFIEHGCPTFIANSFSKNFGLYNERIGALSLYTNEGAKVLENVRSQCAKIIRSLYSNPPAHGAQIVSTILHSDKLKKMWEGELATMRMRLKHIRKALVQELASHDIDARFIEEQQGMFSLLNIKPEQVMRLQEDFHVYMLKSGRINVAGLTTANVAYFAKALATVIRD